MKKVVKSSQIKEIILNPSYYTEDRVILAGSPTRKVQGFKTHWMTVDENDGKNIFILIVEE